MLKIYCKYNYDVTFLLQISLLLSYSPNCLKTLSHREEVVQQRKKKNETAFSVTTIIYS